MRDKIKIRGTVTVQVFDEHGKLKRGKPGFVRRLLGLRGRFMVREFHNIVTREGDALIADSLLEVPVKTKVKSGSGYIQVGTGWTGNSAKTNTRCNTPAGTMKALDGGYPVTKAAWGGAGDNTVVYRATFDAGSLNAVGLNETCLLNGNGSDAVCMAYAQLTPTTSVTENDTLQVLWEITILGQ